MPLGRQTWPHSFYLHGSCVSARACRSGTHGGRAPTGPSVLGSPTHSETSTTPAAAVCQGFCLISRSLKAKIVLPSSLLPNSLHLTRLIHNTDRYVVLDSGFCVLQALIALRTLGVFVGALVKKRRYLPWFIADDPIDAHMSTKNVGETAAVEGSLNNTHCNVW